MATTDVRGVRVFAEKDIRSRTVEILLVGRTPGILSGGEVHLVRGEWVPLADGALAPEPTLSLSIQQAEELATVLWSLNIRPAGQQDVNGELQAVRSHVADLQKMGFGLLDSMLKKTGAS